MNLSKKIKEAYKESDKKVFAVYILLRIAVIICMILQIIQGNFSNVFYCVLTLILFVLPLFVEKKFKIDIPDVLEIIVLIFIFSAEILGEVNEFYLKVPHFDTIMHTLNGFVCCGIGFGLVELLNKNVKNFHLSPFYVTLVAFCFSMTIGVMWEFYEYGSDKFFKTDMQKDVIIKDISSVKLNLEEINVPILIEDIKKTTIEYEGTIYVLENGYLDIGINDTMKDLLVNFIGAIIFCIFGYIHLKHNDKYKFTEKLYLKKQN